MKIWLTLLTSLALGASAQTNIVVMAEDGAWTWYNDPRAVFQKDTLFFGYVRNRDGKTVLSAFNRATGARTDLWESDLSEKDDHNVPGLLARADGRMLAIYARHNTDRFFSYRLSTSALPVLPADWGGEQRVADTGAGMTYANPFQLTGEGGKIYNFARNLNFNPTVFVSTNGGAGWLSPQVFIQNGRGSVRPYVKCNSDGQRRIDFLYTDGHPRDVTNSLYHFYYEGGAFRKTDGMSVKSFGDLPIRHDLGERGSLIYQYSDTPQTNANEWIPGGRAWCWEIVSRTNGPLSCVFTVQRDRVTGPSWQDDRIYYYYARWMGTEWRKRLIAHAGRPLYQAEDDYAGGICLDPENPDVVYISSNAEDPFAIADPALAPLRPNARYEVWRGVTSDGGLTFKWQAVTTNSAKDNLRPYVPRGHGESPALVWFRGNYRSYTSYDCEIVGIFGAPTDGTPR